MQTGKIISILGCGWLGLPLGNTLARSGYSVKGSTTTPAKASLLQESEINPFIINLGEEATWPLLPPFLEADILIISFPPGIRAGNSEKYLTQIQLLAQHILQSPVQYLLFISSSSVYPELDTIMTEAADLSPYIVYNPLLQAEKIIADSRKDKTTIVRFAGLVGGSRHPGRFLAGKTHVANPTSPVNLIHLDDCVQILTAIINQEKWGETYNACADAHPSREQYYTAAAKAIQLPPPQFAAPGAGDTFKIISNEKLKTDLGYQFIYPDPLLFI